MTAAEVRHAASADAAPRGLVRPMLERAHRDGVGAVAGEIRALAARLTAALEWPEADVRAWAEALTPVVAAAAREASRLGVDARLLYDVERACIAKERELLTVDVLGWIRHLGRRPLRRPLPLLRDVHTVKSLRAAHARAAKAHVEAPARERLAALLHDAVARAEGRLREKLTPPIEEAFAQVGFVGATTPGRVAARKVTMELVDVAVERGQLSIGLVRDAISRNALKLDNLRLRELLSGDALLRADDRLASALDGVYRRGEVYMRTFARASELLFSTKLGRFLTLFAILPLGGAYVAIEGTQHVVGPIAAVAFHAHVHHLLTRSSFAVTAAVLFALIHSAKARAVALALLRAVGGVLRLVFVAAPRWIASRPIVRAIARSRVVRLAVEPIAIVLARASALTRHVLPGIVALLTQFFGAFTEGVERGIYAVDSALRYRAGDRPAAVALKGVLAAAWGIVAYALRAIVNVFIEPQLNPLKHFPVVTVAAKFIWTSSWRFLPPATRALEKVLSRSAANAVCVATIILLPGLFGFLVWELKENYKLYRQNQRPLLSPVHIGHHGETMAALLKPGFHSGTIPKACAKLARAARDGGRREAAAREALEHIEEAIRRFIDRELVELLAESSRFGTRAEVGAIGIEPTRVSVELTCSALGAGAATIAFEVDGGLLVAGIERAGWIGVLDEERRVAVDNALAGLYVRAAVDRARGQSDAAARPVIERAAWEAAWGEAGPVQRLVAEPSLPSASAGRPQS